MIEHEILFHRLLLISEILNNDNNEKNKRDDRRGYVLRLILDMLNHTLINYWDTFKTTCRWPVSWSWNYSFCDCSCLEWGPPGHGMAQLASYCTETQHWIVITSLIEKYRLWFEKKNIIQTRHGMHPQPFNFKLSATKNIN